MTEIQKADPSARRMGLLMIGGGTLLGVLLMMIAAQVQPDFEAWVRQDIDARMRVVFAAMTILTAGPALGMAWYLWNLGQGIVRAERFPPPGLRVVRDTPVVIGPAAHRRGRLFQALSVVIGLAALLLAFFLWRLFFLLEREAA